MNTDDRDMKRVRVTESHDQMGRANRARLVESGRARDDSPCWNLGRAKQGDTIRADGTNPQSRGQEDVKQSSRGQKRQGEDVQELTAKGEERHIDADVEMLAHKTWRVEVVAGDAADAAPEQMNNFEQSMTEVFEKIEESLRPLCMVEDLNDDQISNELNACETTAVLNPLKIVSCATRLGLREGFAVDLTTVRANRTMWDLSLEGDRAELRRMQNREQPKLLAGSPPSDDFSSLLNSCGGATDQSLCTSLQGADGHAEALRS